MELTRLFSSQVLHKLHAAGAVFRKLADKLQGAVSFHDFGAVGDGVANDAAAIQAAINYVASLGGGEVHGENGKTYLIQSGITNTTSGVVIDLKRSTIKADFASGWAVTIGDGTTVTDNVGIKNGHITTDRTDVTLNGVLYHKNVRRAVAYTDLRITDFKGTGLRYQELNWSTQGAFNPLIENCGVNLHLDDNANALAIVGAHLKNADTYNLILRGVFAVNFIGGGIENAGTAGVYIDNASVGSLQATNQVTFSGVYFEDNGTNHIVAKNGRGLKVDGCYINGSGMTGPAIKLESWTGASVKCNDVANMSTGTQRDFVEADASCSQIRVSDNVSSVLNDLFVCVQGGSKIGIVEAKGIPTGTLPTASTINRGDMVLYMPSSGTGANRSRPYMCVDIASGSRAFVRVATAPRKAAAAAAASPYTPNVGNNESFDLTINGATTINAPTGPYDDGDEITFLLRQNSTGGFTVTWDAAYKTDLGASGASNQYASVRFMWSAGRSVWVQTGKYGWAT